MMIIKSINQALDQPFQSKQSEKQFLEQQLAGILSFHRIVTIMLYLVQGFMMVFSLITKNYTTFTVVLCTILFNMLQHLYFRRRPSLNCLLILNFYNIGISCFRLYQALIIKDVTGYEHNVNDTFFWGTAYSTINISMLINPYLSTNTIIMIVIFWINMVSAWIMKGEMYYYGFLMLICKILLLWRLRVDLQTKRNSFMMKQEKHRWEQILSIIVEQPYVITTFSKEQLKFSYIDSNQAAKQLFIDDTQSMTQVIRNMRVIHEQKKDQSSLELFIFNLSEIQKNDPQSHIFYKQQLVKSQYGIQYIVKIFAIDQNFNRFLLSFHNITKQEYQQNLHQTIINQQIAFCNVVQEQLRFCQTLGKKLMHNDNSALIELKQQKLNLSNYQNLFKTSQELKFRKFYLKRVILSLNQFFPNLILYVEGYKDRIMSDLLIVNSIFFNFFQIVYSQYGKNVYVVRLEQIENRNTIQVQIMSKSENQQQLFQVISFDKKNKQQLSLMNLAVIKHKFQFCYLMIKKQLKLVSPNDNLDFEFDHNYGK